MAYRKGDRMTSLDELSQQEFVYIFHKVTPCGWFMSFQLHFALDMVQFSKQKERPQTMESNKLSCPMTYNVPPDMAGTGTYACTESLCAWWSEETQKCAVLLLAEAQRKVANKK